eukprot:scaffold291364_cov15-Tisochrysis_lutea.AAC.1
MPRIKYNGQVFIAGAWWNKTLYGMYLPLKLSGSIRLDGHAFWEFTGLPHTLASFLEHSFHGTLLSPGA